MKCICNNCDTIFIDEDGMKYLYENKDGVFLETPKGDYETFIGCGKCMTDKYLMDLDNS